MKKKILSIFIFVLVVAISLTILTGCPKGDGSKVLEIGFLKPSGDYGIFRSGAYSDTDIFEIDNVTLDFYFGQTTNDLVHYTERLNSLDKELVSFVFVIIDGKTKLSGEQYDDYKNIQGTYIMKEITPDDFFSSEYSVRYEHYSRDTYTHHEKFTVPKEVFSGDKAGFSFAMLAVIYDNENKVFAFNNGGGGGGYARIVHYEKLNDSNIKIYNWTWSYAF